MLNFLFSKRKLVAKCEKTTPVFWVMHDMAENPSWVQVEFLDADNQLLQREFFLYDLPAHRESALKQIEQIRQAWVFKTC